jgi:hypothetical protein
LSKARGADRHLVESTNGSPDKDSHMRFMVIVKATKDSEADVLPTTGGVSLKF